MPPDAEHRCCDAAQLKRRLERERAARLEAEAIAENGLRDLYRKQQEIELLARIATAANQAASITDVLQFTVDHVCQATGWDLGHCYLIDEGRDPRLLRSAKTWYPAGDSRFLEFYRASETFEFGCGVGIPGRVFQSGRPVWLSAIETDAGFFRRQVALAAGIKSGGVFPVLCGKDVVAVLEFFSTISRQHDEDVTALMAQIGLQLGRAIERHRAEAALQIWTVELMRARDEAAAADRAKSAFLANISHELRTPLNAVIGFSEMMQMESFGPLGDPRYREYSGYILSNGTHLLAMINDILDLSRMDAVRLELQEDSVAIHDLAEECVHTLAPFAAKALVELSIKLPSELPFLRGDIKRLRQVFLNLLSNAIKFTPSGGEVTLSATLTGNELRIAVSDTGIGMALEQIPKAFERFGQIENSLSRRYDGTGLGLPLAKRLVELHGGSLQIESEIGKGTRVTLSFPDARLEFVRRAA